MRYTSKPFYSTLLIIFGFLMLRGHSLQAQEPKNEFIVDPVVSIPPSPNQAALFEFVEVPVSHYNGIPNISIPLWNLTDGDLSVPISLSYHAGGIRVDEVAPWTGLKWSLSAGGSISRTVKGIPDDKGTGFLNSWDDVPSKLFNTAPGGYYDPEVVSYLENVSEGNLDGAPDMFYYSFPGGSGKFCFGPNQAVHTIPFQKLQFERVNVIGGGFNFEVKTPNGFTYIFGPDTETTSVVSCEGEGPPTESHISTSTDSIILLRYVEVYGEIRRGLAVIKMRGSMHDKQIREFTIDNQ
ncbi:MAG: hypothetical protein AAFR66_22200, partial [Bacteroidota bacterium]